MAALERREELHLLSGVPTPLECEPSRCSSTYRDSHSTGLHEAECKRVNEAKLPYYELTDEGREFSRATAAKPVHRKNADEAIKGLMERVRIVNEDDSFLYRVTTIVLYGSYVRGAERPADVDLAIDVERKISEFQEFHEACWKHLNDSGRECRRIGYECDFPRDEVLVFLKQRKTGIGFRRPLGRGYSRQRWPDILLTAVSLWRAPSRFFCWLRQLGQFAIWRCGSGQSALDRTTHVQIVYCEDMIYLGPGHSFGELLPAFVAETRFR